MFRALMTFLAAVLGVVFFGTPVLLIGLLYPARWLMTCSSVAWSHAILIPAGVRLSVEGGEHLPRNTPCLFVGNHQSALDIPILLAALKGRLRFLAKDSLFRIPVFGWAMSRYEHVPIQRTHPRATLRRLTGMLNRLRERPISFVIFPEGTRSPDGRLLPFRRGTMKICRRAGLTVVPFAISGSAAVHERRRFRIHPGPVRLIFAPAIRADEVTGLTADELHDRVRTAIAERLGPSGGTAVVGDFDALPAERT